MSESEPDACPACPACPASATGGLNIPLKFGQYDQLKVFLQELIDDANDAKCRKPFYQMLDFMREMIKTSVGKSCSKGIEILKNLPKPKDEEELIAYNILMNKIIPFIEENGEMACEDDKLNILPIFDEIAQANCPDYKPGKHTGFEGYYGGLRSLKFELIMIILLVLAVHFTRR